MMALVLGIISVFIILVILVFVFWIIQKDKEQKEETVSDLKLMLENQGYSSRVVVYVNRFLSLMLNKQSNKLYIVRNYSPDFNVELDVEEILIQFIKNFETSKNTIILNYYKSGEVKTLAITPVNEEIRRFIHKIFHISCSKKIIEKLPNDNYTLFGASDFDCNYFWGYSPSKTSFCYLKLEDTIKKPINYIVRNYNLLRENFTIDVKYNYFEAPIEGIPQQLSLYDGDFLSELFNLLLNTIKQKYSLVCEDMIYYNQYEDIAYLTNSTNSLLSIRLQDVEEVEYSQNRIVFILADGFRRVNYIANQDFINEFDDFVVGYNLRKIAHNFNYSTDKLINTTPSTKFIVDFSRARLVYCANINTFSRFNYIIHSFDEVLNVKLEKNQNNIFVRIFLSDSQILDVSCAKYEVAEYLTALIRKVMDKNY